MASTSLQAERFVKIINQHLEILQEERKTVIYSVDHRINQVQSEVSAWINGGNINQTTFIVMNNRIQEILTLFLEKSSELSGKQIDEHKSDLNKDKTINNLTSPGASLKIDDTKIEHLFGSCETVRNLDAAVGSDSSHNMTMRFAILEEAVYSLKNTTTKVQGKLGNVDKMLKDVSTQQVNDRKKVEILTNATLKSEKKLKNKITDLEKRYQDIKSNVDIMSETVTNVDVKLNRLEDENKSVNVSMNELNKQIISVRTCSNDALMSIQDLSKSVESTNQHYNEMSKKMNQLEISINLMSTQYTEQFENMKSLNKDKTDDLIGLVCQLLSKRLTPLEKLNETLNKKVNSGDKPLAEKVSSDNLVAEKSNTVTEIERKCNLPKVGFVACKVLYKNLKNCDITSYNSIDCNHGGHFDKSTGIFTAPLNGLYLISIITTNQSNSENNIINCCKIYRDTLTETVLFSMASKNQTETRCAEIAAGEKLYLEWKQIDGHDSNRINISKMVSKALQAQRFVQIINQQLDVLKEERNTVTAVVDECVNQVQCEVDAWINGGLVNQTTCAEMSSKIQQVIALFIEKSVELSGKQTDEKDSDLIKTNLTITHNLTCPEAKSMVHKFKTEPLPGPVLGFDDSHDMTTKFAILEEAVYSLKKTTEKVEEKIGNFDKILQDVSTQQVKDHKRVEMLTNAKLKPDKKLKDKITDLEKRCQGINSNVNDLFETVTSVDVRLKKLEDENKSVNVSMNELNKQISSFRTCSNDALMPIQDLSKSVESTNQHYNEMSNKMNKMESSINLMSSQCKEQFRNKDGHNKDKTDDLIGLVCQLLAKRLTPLEKLNETLNKKVNSGDKQLSKKDSIEKCIAEISHKITKIELKCNLPKVGFFAFKLQSEKAELCTITSYDQVNVNYGGNFDQSTGIFTAPLNGLYLITIITKNESNTKTNTVNVFRSRKGTPAIVFQGISINRTVTRCAEIEPGDYLYLEWETIDKNDKSEMLVAFSSYMMQKWT